MRERYIIMGVSGCGKSTVGQAVAVQLGLKFVDGDDLHPLENITKMGQGEPLNDADRAPWLNKVGKALTEGTIVACSALKRDYRDRIRNHTDGPVTFLYLRGRRETLIERMKNRQRHFMPVSLLDDQITTLEEPTEDENVILADIENPHEDVVHSLIAKIRF